MNQSVEVANPEHDSTETPVEDAAPFLKVLSGNPNAEEIAALVAVFGAAASAQAEPVAPERNLWGHPVDKLRLPVFSWQRITLLERTHMRR